MLFNKVNSFNYSCSTITTNNTRAGTLTFGTSLYTASGPNIKGSWANLMPNTYTYADVGDSINTTNISKDIYLLEIMTARNGPTNHAIYPVLADFGVDPDGGTNYKIKIKDLIVGAANYNYSTANISYRFPIFIKKGSALAMRIQAHPSDSAIYIRTGIRMWGSPTNKESIFTGSYIETIGQSVSAGTNITIGTTAYGSWVSLGLTTKKICYWNLGIACDNAAMGSRNFYFNLAHGPTKKPIISNMRIVTSNVESVGFYNIGAYHVVPAGTEIFCQGFGPNNQTGFSAIAYGVG